MSTDTKNWKFRAYDRGRKEIESFVIKDRTEGEAKNEAMRFVETHTLLNIDDWTLTPEASTQVQKSDEEVMEWFYEHDTDFQNDVLQEVDGGDIVEYLRKHYSNVFKKPTQVQERGIELKAEHNEIWQRIVPVIGSEVFTPLLVFEHTPVIGKYTRQSMAEKLCYAWNNIDRLEEENKKNIERVLELMKDNTKLMQETELNSEINLALSKTIKPLQEELNKANAEKAEMLEALNRIRKLYDNVEDAAGVIAREAYDKFSNQ